jgi:hypothetical protein
MIWEIVGSILFSLVAAEIYASCPRLTTALLKRAKRALPEEYQDRYWEEWMGELDAQSDRGNLSRLIWAVWILCGSRRMGRVLWEPRERQSYSLALAKGYFRVIYLFPRLLMLIPGLKLDDELRRILLDKDNLEKILLTHWGFISDNEARAQLKEFNNLLEKPW